MTLGDKPRRPVPPLGGAPEAGAGLDTDAMRQYVTLRNALAVQEAEAKATKDQMAILEEQILSNLAREGVGSVKVLGTTLFIRTQRWARAKEGDKERAIAALREVGLGDFVAEGFNTQTVSAWLREQVRDEIDIPEAFTDAFDTTETFKLGTRKS